MFSSGYLQKLQNNVNYLFWSSVFVTLVVQIFVGSTGMPTHQGQGRLTMSYGILALPC